MSDNDTTIEYEVLDRIGYELGATIMRCQEALDDAVDAAARLNIAYAVVDAVEGIEGAVSVSLYDWEDAAEGDEPFAVDLDVVFATDGERICSLVGGALNGAIGIRHHWVLDMLRVDPDAADGDKHHPGHRLSVAKCGELLSNLIAVYS